ncbi:MAG: RNA polymerase sigma-70 factor [Tannerella sp.]|jgi:RNA polymerase sigma-70 factor (ECF subfamily)|nr:RNA polymerase sigma-70 factor [Tannerella sp.]
MPKHSDTATDKNHIILLNRGDTKGFEAIYYRYAGRVYNFLRSLLHDDTVAEDLTQDVFLKIWEKRETIDPDGHFEAYLFTIARHLLYKEAEKRMQEEYYKEIAQETDIQSDTDFEQHFEAESLRAYINNLIAQLPPMAKKVFLMSRVHHLSHKEIAQFLSISVKTVETHIYRSLQFLRKKLSEKS